MMRTFWYAGLLLLTGIVLFACQSGDLNVGQSVINPKELLIQSVDSVTIQASTVLKPDSFLTSTDPNILVGQWTDTQTGKLTARSFTSLDYTSNSFFTQKNIQFDSLVLEMGYAFTYGDTLSSFNLGVYRLTQPLNNQLYYHINTAGYETKPLMQQTFTPRPVRGTNGTTLVRLRAPDALFQSFYAKLTDGSISDAATLTNFLPGFAFVSQSSAGNTFLGFATNSTSTGLRLYYHSTDITETTTTVATQSLLFPITSIHFTQLLNDRKGTALNALQVKTDAVSSRLTDNTSFVSWGAGLQTRIDLPYLQNFARPDQFADLNSALLVVGPIRRDILDNAPPMSQLALYEVNSENTIIATVPGGSSGATAAVAPYVYDRSTLPLSDTYTFDLTAYIGQIIKRQRLGRSLMLTLPIDGSTTPSLRTLVQRATLGNQQKQYTDQLKLKLFMTSGQ